MSSPLKALHAGAPIGLDELPDNEGSDPDASRIEEPRTREKIRAALAYKLAVAGGFTLLELSDRTFLISHRNMSRHCADLQAVSAFARQVGAT